MPPAATGKKAVVFRGSKEDFTAALNDPGYVSSRRLAESAATDAEASLSAAASTIESGKNSSRRPSVTVRPPPSAAAPPPRRPNAPTSAG